MKIFFVFLMIFFSISVFGEPETSKDKVDVKEDKTKITKPKWTNTKKELVKVDGKYYFRGLGVSKDINNPKVSLTDSKNKAKSQIYYLLKEYLAMINGEGVYLDMSLNDYFNLAKTKPKLVKTWSHPETKAIYTLFEMDVNFVKVKLSTSFIDNAKQKLKVVTPVVLPDWATYRENKLIKKAGKYYLQAVGSSSDLGDEGMTLSASADNARVNLSYFLKTTVKSITTKSSNGDKVVSSEIMTKMKFSGTRVVKRWVHPNTKTVYTLLEVSIDDINKYNNNLISPEMIKTMSDKSEESYNKMNKKLDNLGGF